jgi:UDP:flavonoid glycosyltransferase YjiC (YdhE family)
VSRVVLLAVGSRGDVEPCVALGRGLRAAGHAVRIAALAPFRADVTAQGVDFVSLGDLPERFRGRRGPSFSGLAGRVAFWAVYRRLLAGYLPAFVEACRGADLIVHTGLAFPGYHLAEAMGVPCASVAFVPGAPTREHMHPLFADRRLSRGPAWNRATFAAEQALMMQSTAALVTRWRTRTLGLPAVPRRDLVAHRWRRTDAVLLGVSPHLVPRPADWGERVHVTGALHLDGDFAPDPALGAFLEAGPAPVYVGFGSMSDADGARLAAAVVEALRRLGLRGVLARGWGGLRLDDAAPHVHVVDAVPHAWLFARVRAAVHHGGAGTTDAALRAGLPAVVVPFDYDQRFWGRLLAERGLGPAPIPPARLDADTLAAALRALDAYRERVAPLAAAMRTEDGVAAAVRILESLLRS